MEMTATYTTGTQPDEAALYRFQEMMLLCCGEEALKLPVSIDQKIIFLIR